MLSDLTPAVALVENAVQVMTIRPGSDMKPIQTMLRHSRTLNPRIERRAQLLPRLLVLSANWISQMRVIALRLSAG